MNCIYIEYQYCENVRPFIRIPRDDLAIVKSVLGVLEIKVFFKAMNIF